ncbi:ubiquitin carboxyl-terminal hydrolase-domain-containing protein [Phycomyces blakesleeanus]
MSTEDYSEAIYQLMDLGITQKQAHKALTRYNFDVARAADYIFSGNADDEEIPVNTTTTASNSQQEPKDWPIWNQEDTAIVQDTHSMDSTRGSAGSTQVLQDSEYEEEPIRPESNKPDQWSVVPFVGPPATPILSSDTAYTPSALTRWRDPDDPRDRLAKEHIPLGLCPPSHHFTYAPALFQALFHVPLFRKAILAFRPVPIQWGTPLNYWKGFGDAVSPFTYCSQDPMSDADESDKKKHLQNSQELNTSEEGQSNYDQSQEEREGGINGSGGNSNDDCDDGWPDLNNPDLKSTLEKDIQSMPLSLRVLAEIQKLFAFLSLSKRRYGNVSPVIRALSARMASPHWEFSDKNIDGFLDMLIGCLVETDGLSEKSNESTPSFRDCRIDHNSHSFHECLDPLVYESESTKDDDELSSNSSIAPIKITKEKNTDLDVGNDNAETEAEAETEAQNEAKTEIEITTVSDTTGDQINIKLNTSYKDDNDIDDGQVKCKVTTFEQIPPILIVTLEDRTEETESSDQSDSEESFRLDHTIYLDRYLTANKSHSKEKYQQAEKLRATIAQNKLKKRQLTEITIDNFNKFHTTTILEDTLKYLQAKKDQSHIPTTATDTSNTTASNTHSTYNHNNVNDNDHNSTNTADTTKVSKVIENLKATESAIISAGEFIKKELKDLEANEKELGRKLESLFDENEMKRCRYDLYCTVYNDGQEGKGHTWAYIRVNHTQSEGHWFRFRDASVEPVTAERVERETMTPLMLFYMASTSTANNDNDYDNVSKQEQDQELEHVKEEEKERDCITASDCLSVIPKDLVAFVQEDNAQFEEEIYSISDWQTLERLPISCASTSEGSLVFDDGDSVGTAVGFTPTNRIDDGNNNNNNNSSSSSSNANSDDDNGEDGNGNGNNNCHIPLSPNSYDELCERRENLVRIANQSTEVDLLQHFHLFLAKTGNKDALDHFIDLYWRNPNGPVEEKKARRDDELGWVFAEFDSFVRIGKRVARGLMWFGQGDHRKALQTLVQAKREEEIWKTHLLVDTLGASYHGLETLGFGGPIEQFGKHSLKILNLAAYQKVKHVSYRTRGLEDALWIAHQAHTVIGPERLGTDPVFGQLGEIWYSLTDEIENEQPSAGLTTVQAELLNSLMMAYLDGQTCLINDPEDEREKEEEKDGHTTDKEQAELPIWKMYEQGHRAATKVLIES